MLYISIMRHTGNIEAVKIPKAWRESVAVSVLYSNTRWYYESGSEKEFRHWVQEISDARIDTIPLQWVPEYVGVSRNAVLKRAKSGGLTVFSFIFIKFTRNVLGHTKAKDSKKQYDLVPLAECDQWREIIISLSSDKEGK